MESGAHGNFPLRCPGFYKGLYSAVSAGGSRFSAAYDKLSQFRTRLIRYGEGQASLSRSEFIKFRSEIAPAISDMRSVIPFYRQTFFRLQELNRFMNEGGAGRDVQVGDVSASDFFRTFSSRFMERRRQIAGVEYWFKLYTALSKSDSDPFGGESLMDDFFSSGEESLLEEF